MAAVSAPQATGSALTPPTSSHSNWDFSVPVPNTSQDYAYSSKEPLPHDHNSDRRHMAPLANGSRRDAPRPTRSNSHEQSVQLAPTRINALSTKQTPLGGNSPADSLLDLYSNSNKSGSTSLHDGERSNVAGNKRNSVAMMDEDDPGWIHRDKLARIESRELQAAGIILPRNRAYSKTGRSSRSRETSASGLGQRQSDRGQQKRQQLETSQSYKEEEDQEQAIDDSDDKEVWDLRSPEEIEADNNASYNYERSILSKGASKIPLAMQSRVPVPLDYIERDAPVQRAKSTVWGSDGEGGSIEYPRQHVRAASVEPEAPQPPTAPVLLPPPPKQRDSANGPGKRDTQSATHSPTKNAPGGGGGGGGVRKSATSTTKTPPLASKTHGNNGHAKQRSMSRPATRGTGEVKRPEGDPPWLATMFKPDPRLPPDQQLLPTVAKRIAQENWEKEGKFGNAYDTNFRPLNEEELRRQELPPSPVKGKGGMGLEIDTQTVSQGAKAEWPLKSPDSAGRPSTSGGYSTMPRIESRPQQPPPMAPMEVGEGEGEGQKGKKEAKGGCGCCVVM